VFFSIGFDFLTNFSHPIQTSNFLKKFVPKRSYIFPPRSQALVLKYEEVSGLFSVWVKASTHSINKKFRAQANEKLSALI